MKVVQLRRALGRGDIETFISEMRGVIASVQYQFFKVEEQAFQFIFTITTTLIGGRDLRSEIEKQTNRGRIDMVIELPSYIYIVEFKLDKSPEEALKQIHEKGYAEQWKNDKRKVVLLGVSFSSEERNIPLEKGWEREVLPLASEGV